MKPNENGSTKMKKINLDTLINKVKDTQTTTSSKVAQGKFKAKVVGYKVVNEIYNDKERTVAQFIVAFNSTKEYTTFLNTRTYNLVINERSALCILAKDVFDVEIKNTGDINKFLEKMFSSSIMIKVEEKNGYATLDRIIDTIDEEVSIHETTLPDYLKQVYGKEPIDVQLVEGYSFKSDSPKDPLESKIEDVEAKEEVQDADDFFESLNK